MPHSEHQPITTMRLPKPFYKLAVRFDAARLRAEAQALPASAWVAHPNAIDGNSAVRLITADGGENDAVYGYMLPTAHLQQCPYIRQILASFGVVWSRSRLMRLAPRANVPEHADINHHWFNRVRLHIPVVTRPAVQFHCGDQHVHMAAGEAWLFDNWRLHRVENPTDEERIHLVADTTGSASFWQFVAQSETPNVPMRELPFDPGRDATPLTERSHPRIVMHPAEVELLLMDFRAELMPHADTPPGRAALARYHALLDGFCRDWRQLYLLHGESEEGFAALAKLRDVLREASRQISEDLVMRTNGVLAHTVLQGRLLQHLVYPRPDARSNAPSPASKASRDRERIRRPIFIVAAPRSGSTLLFETLAVNRGLYTLGGEAHWLVESMPELQPTTPGVGSNRLTSAHVNEAIEQRIVASVIHEARSAEGQPLASDDQAFRFLEKTPKNSLRIPFFDRIFPDARFIFLWRDPRENLSSIIEAWNSGNWITYRGLPGWEGPWSLLLPPGWETLAGRPREEIAAYQWDCTNRIVIEDLEALPRARWTVVNYSGLVSDPKATIRRLCEFAEIEFDAATETRVSAPLPLSRYTHTPPQTDKWRRNGDIIERVLPGITATWERLKKLQEGYVD